MFLWASGCRKFAADDLFDLIDGMVRQGFGNFADHPLGYFLMHLVAQLPQRLRRCCDNKAVKLPIMCLLVQDFGEFLCKSILCQLMPVGVVYSGAMDRGSIVKAPAPVCGLNTVWRIVLRFFAKDVQKRVFALFLLLDKQLLFKISN